MAKVLARSKNYLKSLKNGDVICVKNGSQWFRATILHNFSYEEKFLVRLVDTGMVTTVLGRRGWDYIRLCPPQFLKSPALSFSCHLQSVQFVGDLLTEEVLEKIKTTLPDSELVDLQMYRNGGPVLKRFRDDETEVEFEFYSLPVELTWKIESSDDDPFLPMKVLFFSLTDLFLDHLGIANDGLDTTTDLLNDGDYINPTEKEFTNVHPRPTNTKNSSFQWLPPELPGKSSFYARGIFVDQSGQIYIQLASLKYTIAALRRLLDEKFTNSPPDDEETPMHEGQECCVRWRDGSWTGRQTETGAVQLRVGQAGMSNTLLWRGIVLLLVQ